MFNMLFKKIFLISILAASYFVSNGQFANNPAIAAKTDLYHSRGGIVGDSGTIISSVIYNDTIAANLTAISHYSQAIIITSTGGYKAWFRTLAPPVWNTFGTGGGGTTDSTIFATIANARRIADSAAAAIVVPSQFNPSVIYPIKQSGTYPNITTYADTSTDKNSLSNLGTVRRIADSAANAVIVPAQFNPIAGYATLITGTYPNKTFSSDSILNASRARVQKSVDSLGLVKQPTGNYLVAGNNLADVSNIATSRTNLNVFSKADSIVGGFYPYSTNPKGYLTSIPNSIHKVYGTNGVINVNDSTLQSDTVLMATRSRVQKPIDSLGIVKLNVSDTSGMLTNYRNNISALINDSAYQAAQILLRVKYTDTASMLSPYQRSAFAVKYSDTANIVSGYQRKLTLTTTGSSGAATLDAYGNINIPQYSTSLSGYVQFFDTTYKIASRALPYKINDSMKIVNAATYVPQTRTLTINGTALDLSANRSWSVGTVTSVATSVGLTGGTITSTGTLQVDTGRNNLKIPTGNDLNQVKDSLLAVATHGTVTSVAALTLGTTGTDLSSTVANGTTTPVITLNVPTASASNRGALSSTDWTTFNNKASSSSTFTLGSTSIALGSTTTTVAGLTSVTSTSFVGALSGNATTANTLATPRAINGVNFDGSAAITITAAAGTLTGTTLNSTVVSSSLTSVGTIGTGVWQGTAIADSYISSASTWNGKQSALSGTGIVKSVSGTISYLTDNSGNWNTAYGWGNWASNFGSSAGTIAQGNDSRINNGQTAYSWGNPSGAYLPLAGGTLTGALSGTSASFSSTLGVTGAVTGGSIIKSGGTSTQFLMADGSVNTSVLPSGAYLPLAAGSGSPLTGHLYINDVGTYSSRVYGGSNIGRLILTNYDVTSYIEVHGSSYSYLPSAIQINTASGVAATFNVDHSTTLAGALSGTSLSMSSTGSFSGNITYNAGGVLSNGWTLPAGLMVNSGSYGSSSNAQISLLGGWGNNNHQSGFFMYSNNTAGVGAPAPNFHLGAMSVNSGGTALVNGSDFLTITETGAATFSSSISGTSALMSGSIVSGGSTVSTSYFSGNVLGVNASLPGIVLNATYGTTKKVSIGIDNTISTGMLVFRDETVGANRITFDMSNGAATFASTVTAPQYSSTVQTLTDGATITFNANSGSNAVVTLGGNRTLAFSNQTAGTYYTLRVIQDGTGSRTLAMPSGSKVINGGAGAVTLSTAASAVDLLTFYYDGTNYWITYGNTYN